jgi:hypothetical protein
MIIVSSFFLFPIYWFNVGIEGLLNLLQSLLAALGSIQFVSNIAFAYFVLNEIISVKYVCFSLAGDWNRGYN